MSGPERDWDSSILRHVLLALILIKLIGVIVVFSWTGQFGFDLPKALWSRLGSTVRPTRQGRVTVISAQSRW